MGPHPETGRSTTSARRRLPAKSIPTCPSPLIQGGKSMSGVPCCGPFHGIPLEIRYLILDYLTFFDLGQLSLTNRVFRTWVAAWLQSRPALVRLPDLRTFLTSSPIKKLMSPPLASGSPESAEAMALIGLQSQPHVAFALLCKRLTFLYGSQERIRFANRYFDLALKSCQSQSPQSEDWEDTLVVIVYFQMLHAFTRGWDESEFSQVIAAAELRFGIQSQLSRFVKSDKREDVCVVSEMHLRLVLRSLTWDFVGKDYTLRATWILTIIRRFVWQSPRAEAMTFFLLFGPTCDDNVSHYEALGLVNRSQRVVMEELNNHADWSRFEDSNPEDFHEGKAMFYTLAQAICSCVNANKKWRTEHVNRVLDELFKVPRPWRRDNVAGFLLFCSEKLILDYLRDKLSCGSLKNVETVARLLFDMILVSYRFDNELNPERGIGKIFDLMCKFPTSKDMQLRLFEEVWRVALLEMDTFELTSDEEELSEVIRNMGVHLMRHAYLNTIPPVEITIKAEDVSDDLTMEE
ncbi:hypothetical protein TCAL_08697 [Tigriopus californicus]|uniref:FBXO47 ARM repeats region domain-containing protein n=1 Tax=Tigriopus californicus TaxID=6832 RepID=A0A553NDN9_TIGCA|nr:uncharacterized protein LOC131889633 [Tigriopus californicus]TRY63560.1 hypothetical protein TCAL_08697 [Tigriopus californicus]